MKLLDKLVSWYFSKDALPYWCVFIIDCIICYLSGLFVFWLYYNGAVTLGNIILLTKTIFMYMVFNLIGFKFFRTYTGVIRYSTVTDLVRVGCAMFLSLFVAEVMHYVIYYWHLHFIRLQGRQIVAMYLVATVGMMAFRMLVKTLYEVLFSSNTGMRTFIYGVQKGGIGLAKNIRNEKPARFQLKGFIAPDAYFSGRRLLGVRVYKNDEDLIDVLKSMNVQVVLVSPLQNKAFRRDGALQDRLIQANIHIYMVAESEEWTPEKNTASALKEISIEDLLPRNEIQVDMEAIGRMITGKKILITGSAGSIGKGILEQIAVYHPSELMLIDQAETPQHDIRLMMARDYPKIKATVVVETITNEHRMEYIFNRFRPDYVFHAAAYKHVPMMEDNPYESVLNNIRGTKVIADLAVKYGVKKFVMLSTDKAVNPTNVMGCSKRICEIYIQSLDKAIKQGTTESLKDRVTQFVTTRFGNVLGSNGSVIPLFEKQIKAGGPLTVTDPNIIRFFMLIPEACKLVLEAGTHGNGGEIFVFDMGEPVKIADLAKRMILLSGAQNVQIKYTGLREGEKLYEEVLSKEEDTLPSFNPKIRIAKVRQYEYGNINQEILNLIDIAQTFDDMKIVKKMKELVPEFKSKNSVYEQLDNN